VRHGDWENAYGYRFTTPDRVIVISGDAAPDANIEAFAKGADILLHEVYSVSGFARRNEFWQKYHRNNHTSAHELGEIATRVQPRLLVLYHVLFWGSSEEVVLDEVREKYSGRVVLGRDLDVY
jgi:ribonuclease Z